MEYMPPGFRFYPTEEELVSFYLHIKLEGKSQDINHLMNRVIPVVDIYEFNPWDLPQLSVNICHKDPEQWFFFIPMKESEARGARPKRLTDTGYWKATGSPGFVYSGNSRPIGVKRTMVFYNGRAPNGKKTEWKMNEYKAIQGEASPDNGAPPTLRQEFSLCRVYKKSKCLRSFDRRPVQRDEAIPFELGNDLEVEKSHQNTETADRARANSPESSSSGDNHGNYGPNNTDQTAAGNNSSIMVVDDDYSFWDLDGFWDHVN